MLEKLETLEARYEELSHELGDPSVVASPDKLRDTAKAHADLRGVVDKYQQYKQILQQQIEARRIIEVESDEELLELARDEVGVLEARREECEQELKTLLIPTDPNDQKNVILEIRAGTGVTRLLSSPRTYSACTPDMPIQRAGKSAFFRCTRPRSVESKRS